MTARRPRLAVHKLSSCDGCQLGLLDDARLLDLAAAVDIAYFLEATSRVEPGPYDVAVVEGSVSTEHDRERVEGIRRSARILVAAGACATAGGIQALRNFADLASVAVAYPHPERLHVLATSTSVSDHVPVDLELHGCPVDARLLLSAVDALLHGRRPLVPDHSVCLECKARDNVCVLVARKVACVGPITIAGCGALCPAYDRGCYGCGGPIADANVGGMRRTLAAAGVEADEVRRALHGITAWAPQLREVSRG